MKEQTKRQDHSILRKLFSTKVLVFCMAMALTASTVSIYAAGITGQVGKIAGTGDVISVAPTTDSYTTWDVQADGLAHAAKVTWTPTGNSNYVLRLIVSGATSTLAIVESGVTGSGVLERTDTLTFASPVDPIQVTKANLVISET